MNPRDRRFIIDNIDSLAQKIVFDIDLTSPLINKNIFTQTMIDDILKISDEMERKKRFLSDLCRRGPDACDQLVEVLYGIGQLSAATELRPKYFTNEHELSRERIIENITNSPVDPNGGPIEGGDNGEIRPEGTVGTVVNDDYMINVKKCKKEMSGQNIYPMQRNPRGFCIIFNIIDYKDPSNYPRRLGSDAEANALRDVFSQLHFIVDVVTNLSQNEVKQKIGEISQNCELQRHDAFILIFLSHGERDYVVCSDGIGLQFENIVNRFNNENCVYLRGKPKLFFFSCCRGRNVDNGPRYQPKDYEEVVSDARKVIQSIIPIANDMMISYATVDGFVAWRNEQRGTWFGTSLCQALMKHAHKEDLHHILTIASAAVTNRITQNGERQVMEHTYRGFTKLFYFNPGIIPGVTPNALNQ